MNECLRGTKGATAMASAVDLARDWMVCSIWRSSMVEKKRKVGYFAGFEWSFLMICLDPVPEVRSWIASVLPKITGWISVARFCLDTSRSLS